MRVWVLSQEGDRWSVKNVDGLLLWLLGIGWFLLGWFLSLLFLWIFMVGFG